MPWSLETGDFFQLKKSGPVESAVIKQGFERSALGQVAWTPSLGVEALRKKAVRLRQSKKREGKERG